MAWKSSRLFIQFVFFSELTSSLRDVFGVYLPLVDTDGASTPASR